jgi:hypothetical protein
VGRIYGLGWAERPKRAHWRAAAVWLMTAAVALGAVLVGVALDGHTVPPIWNATAISLLAAGILIGMLTFAERRHPPAVPSGIAPVGPVNPGGLVAGVASFGDHAVNFGNTTIIEGPRSTRVSRGPDEPRSWLDVSDLQAACAGLAREIFNYLDDRGKDDPKRVPHWHGISPDADPAEKLRAFNEHTARSIAHDRDTLSGYDSRFLGRALALYDEIDHRGWFESPDRVRIEFQHPTNEIGVRRVASQLAKAGAATR